MAPGCTLVLVLMLTTVALSRTGAVPVPSAPRALPPARGCHVAQFKSLSPQELQAFKTARDAFVSLPTPPAVGEPPAPSCGFLDYLGCRQVCPPTPEGADLPTPRSGRSPVLHWMSLCHPLGR